ncbi:MAG: methionine adenosyltransferase domain-containing protein [Victivallales bacterium]|nr:methionine adenosyltransferase domain-containing protein [Victivallales bacterium]
MIKTSEWVSLGHPDKTADYISCYLLDRYLEKDPKTHFAVEVMLKDNFVTLGGEVSSKARFSSEELEHFVREAVNEVGYTREYQAEWGKKNTICGDDLKVTAYLGLQSDGIGQGVDRDAWGDQGIFHGMAVNNPDFGNMPLDYSLAKKLGRELFRSNLGGLDIKTLVATNDGRVSHVTIAIPQLPDSHNTQRILDIAREITGCSDILLNGTGSYVSHSSIADCGITGRKLAVDFYGGNCRIGGGSPWTKDATKADLTLNLHARKLALDFMQQHKRDCVYTSLSCSIGSAEVEISYQDSKGSELQNEKAIVKPSDLIGKYQLDTPIFTSLCRDGLFSRLN